MEVVPASSLIPVTDPIRSGGPWRIISGGLSPTCRNGPGLSCLFQAIGRNGILPFMSASDRVSISTTIIFRHILTRCAGMRRARQLSRDHRQDFLGRPGFPLGGHTPGSSEEGRLG